MSATPPVIVQTPRSKFMSVPENITQHNRLLDNAALQRGLDVAMAELVRAIIALSGGKDLDAPGANQATATCFAMISGAQQFVEVFARLAEPYQVRPAKTDKVTSLTEEN
jgi:hypothetical protein